MVIVLFTSDPTAGPRAMRDGANAAFTKGAPLAAVLDAAAAGNTQN